MSGFSKKHLLFTVLGAFFITNAIMGEILGGKLITVGPFTMTVGVLPWPLVFLTTDLINEYFGKKGVQRLTFLAIGLIVYMFVILWLGMQIPAASFSPVKDPAFNEVFGQSMWIIVGSIVAFAVSQLVDVAVFWMLRDVTKGKMLWLRATGSTAVSQLIDSFIVIGIAFWISGQVTFKEFMTISSTNYIYKLLVAIGLTPFIYLGHKLIDNYLGKDAEKLIEQAAVDSHK